MNAWPWLCAPKGDDAPYFCQGQSETPGLRYEVKHAEDIQWIRAVAGWGCAATAENASRLVQPQGLAAQTAALSHLADKQPVLLYEGMIGRPPRGKVKCRLGMGTPRPGTSTGAWLYTIGEISPSCVTCLADGCAKSSFRWERITGFA